ncbi:MAG: EAL domain-containing protein [Methylotenera sp.]|nr:EAL domain-containing protein [Methylotenera sp.]
MLAYRSQEETTARWSHLAATLNKNISQYEFILEVYTQAELDAAVASRTVDFVFTNPAHYIKLSRDSGLSAPLATLIANENNHPTSVFGGLIFTRNDQNEINSLADITNKTVAIVDEASLGGYQMQNYELRSQGFQLKKSHIIRTGIPHDNVVTAVLSGQADVGFVRSGVIESMVREGILDNTKLKIINKQQLSDFPFVVSTRLYPEWPFASMSHVNGDVSRKVAAMLFNLQDDYKVTNQLGIYGFSVPADYTSVIDLMRELRMSPFDFVPSFSLNDVIKKYQWQVFVLLLGLTVIGILSMRLLLTKRYLQLDRQSLIQQKNLFQESKLELQAILNAIPDLLFDLDINGRYHAVHSADHGLLAFSTEALIGKTVDEVLSDSSAKTVMLALEEADVSGFSKGKEIELNLPQGIFWFELSVAKKDNLTAASRFIMLSRDITARKLADAELRLAATAFKSNEGILITDKYQVILNVNPAFTEITGYTAQEVIGKTPRILNSGLQDADFYKTMWDSIEVNGSWKGDIWNKRKNGEVYPEHLVVTAVKDSNGNVINFIAALTDITKNVADAKEIERLAFYDSLTGLPNRRLLMDRLNQAIAMSARSVKNGALLFIDLDHFKTLNDSMGHSYGDLLLQQVAKRLIESVREGDTVARLGGDEFVVVLESLSTSLTDAATQVEYVGEKILNSLSQPYQIDTYEHYTTVSIGATLFSGHGSEVEELLKQADIAMYQAKKSGRNNIRFFDPEMQSTINNLAELETELRKALERDQFELFYQPQVDANCHPVGVEALIRWQHPDRGLISPFYFIPLAEDSGLILPIGEWVLNTACKQLHQWQQHSSTKDLTVSINVSAKQFRQVDFVRLVQSAVIQHKINPSYLKLELTESILLEKIDQTIATMNTLKDIGVQFSLDDFGTGYSSLQYLKKLPLDQLKIDQSFVRDIAEDVSDQAIVRTIIAMAQTLNLNVIAEGVETEQQRQLLEVNGCSTYQGYLFAKPMSIDQLAVFLERLPSGKV